MTSLGAILMGLFLAILAVVVIEISLEAQEKRRERELEEKNSDD